MSELMRHPKIMEKVQEEVREVFKGKEAVDKSDLSLLKYLKLVIKETIRLHPPVAILPRLCKEDCVVDNYLIPVKTRVIFNIWS